MALPPIGAEVPAAATAPTLPPVGGEVPSEPHYQTSNAKDANGNAVVDPNTVGTLIRHWWSGGGNPLQLGQLLPFPKAGGGSGLDNPLLPSNVVQQMHAVKQAGDALWNKGDKGTAVAKYVESIIPLIGPWMSQQGDLAQQGKYAAVAGNALGLATGVAEGQATTGALESAYPLASHPMATNPQFQASQLERDAAQQVSQRVLAPSNPSQRVAAARIAPEVLARGLQGDRAMLQQVADEGKSNALAQMDAAVNLDPAAPVGIQPTIDSLDTRIAQFKGPNGQTIPGSEGRVNALQSQRDFLKAQGPSVPFAQLRNLRIALDNQADEAKVYARAGTNQAASDQGQAAADAAGALRQPLATTRPELAGPNADYAFFSALSDVLDPVIGRPRNLSPNQTGVTGGAATQSAVMLGTMGKLGVPAAALRTFISVLNDVKSSPAWQLADASKKLQMAQALRAGNIGAAQSLLLNLAKRAPQVGPAAAASTAIPSQGLATATAP